MALIAVQPPSSTGVAIVYTQIPVSNTFVNSGREYLHVKNLTAFILTVTVTAPNPCSFGVTNAAHADVVVLAAGADAEIGPFSKDRHNNASNIVTVNYTATGALTGAVDALLQ